MPTTPLTKRPTIASNSSSAHGPVISEGAGGRNGSGTILSMIVKMATQTKPISWEIRPVFDRARKSLNLNGASRSDCLHLEGAYNHPSTVTQRRDQPPNAAFAAAMSWAICAFKASSPSNFRSSRMKARTATSSRRP